MNNIGLEIRKLRDRLGFSQDYMATELSISQASYARLESEETLLSVKRLFEIAKLLRVKASQILAEDAQNTFHQKNNDGSYGNGYVQNLYAINQDTLDKILATKDELITKQQEEINFLRNIFER